MLRFILMGLISTAALALLSNFVARLAAVRRKGQTVHRLTAPGPLLWTALLLAFGISIVIWLASYVRDYSGPLALLMCVVYIALVLILAGFLLFHHVFWTSDGIGSWDPWRKGRFISWSEVSAVHRLWPLGVTIIEDSASRIVYSPLFQGTKELAAFLAANRVRGFA